MSGDHDPGWAFRACRRTVLGAAAAATGITLGAQPAAAHGTLVPHSEIGDQLTWGAVASLTAAGACRPTATPAPHSPASGAAEA